MSTKIGHFEILSELAKSPTGTVYKANDPQSGQTVALKAIDLSAFGDSASALEQALLQEAESTKSLSHSNISPVLGAGEIEGKFCATMEYVQGNSVATMLARKEGFSIWDLLDIGRQVCNGLDYAHASQLYHFSLEPAKIMCGWDGTVKILSYGVSSAGKFAKQISNGIPSFLYYMSPEQVKGGEIDARSNIFSLGAMFYEMVTERKPFDRPDADNLRECIVESTPVPPMHINAKLHPQLSDLIMKALEKDPAARYQKGRELLDDLEKCKESKPAAAKAPAAKGTVAAAPAKAAVQGKFVGTPAPAVPRQAAPAAAPRAPEVKAPAKPAEKKSTAPAATGSVAWGTQKPKAEPAPKAAAAAAGFGGPPQSSSPSFESADEIDLSHAVPAVESVQTESAYMSAAAPAPEVETFAADAPKIAVDPMMAEGGPGAGGGTSFSEISELPPLKEAYVAPPPPPPLHEQPRASASAPTVFDGDVAVEEEKPKIQPREVAQKAIKEIKGVPPKLLLYSIGAAVALILGILLFMTFRIHSESGDDDSSAPVRKTATTEEAQPAPSQPAPSPAAATPAPAAEAQPTPAVAEPEPAEPRAVAATPKTRGAKRKAAPPPAIVPGQLVLDSTPQGAQIQIDGSSDPSWVTPVNISNLQPGAHTVVVSKAGYTTDTRSVDVASGSKSTVVIHLAQLMASLAVTSEPAGASIFIDGRDSGKVTPAHITVDKGTHVILVRKMGYIDETSSAQFTLGQTVSISPTLRPLGNVDSIRTTGKFKKLFGGSGAQPGQGTVSIRTTPKGAQVSVNQRMLDKNSPVDVMLDPGNYVIDITLSGYAPVQKVITIDKGGKVVVDEVLHQ